MEHLNYQNLEIMTCCELSEWLINTGCKNITIEFNEVASTVVQADSVNAEMSHDLDTSSTIVEPKIVNGKLLFKNRWYRRGQSVIVKGREIAKFSAVISAIDTDTIRVKKRKDKSEFCINLSYLLNGSMSIKRRAAF